MVQRTMESFPFITALLFCSLSWMSDSVSVEVQPGEEVTLQCLNITKEPAQTEWFRLINGSKPSCISSIYGYGGDVAFCDGFLKGFEMSSNISTVFLTIKRVVLSDSGLYFCGFYKDAHTVISYAIHLIVQGNSESDGGLDIKTENEPDSKTDLMSLILVGLTVFLTILVIVLAVKIRKLQKAVNEETQTERNENLGSDELNYAALSFQAKAKRSHRPALGREPEPNVVYAATR